MAALALEVLWSRALVPWVGGTALSQIMTVAMYMFGLFLGSAVAVVWSKRTHRPRHWFFVAEAAAVVCSTVAVFSLPALDPLFALCSRGDLLASDWGAALRAMVGSAMILPATTLMGLGFPLAIAALQRSSPSRGAAALAYGVNTLGATAGTCLGGFLLLPWLGVTGAALVVLFVDLVVLGWAWRGTGSLGDQRTPRSTEEVSQDEPWLRELPMLVAVTAGGALALALEVLLFRILGMMLGPTARAFTVVLASYVFGLGAGALLVKGMVSRSVGAARAVFLGCWMFVGLAGFLLVIVVASRPDLLMLKSTGDSVLTQTWRRLVIAIAVLVPLTLAFGASYSAAVACGVRAGAARAGRLYAGLTVGNIAGLVLAALWMMPEFGIDGSVRGLFCVALLIPLPVLWTGAWRAGTRVALTGVFLAGAFVVAKFAPEWERKTLNAAPYLYDDSAESQQYDHFLFFESGFETTVAVIQRGDDRMFTLDGKTDGSTLLWDRLTQTFAGALPAALHPQPESALVIGLGTGQTAATVLRFPSIAQVDCAELSPLVVDALPYFDSLHQGILEDPRFRVLKTDGRTTLRYGHRQYDLIVSEPSNVWVPGVAHLFTQETFEEARGRLADGGILMQWLHSYNMDEEAFRTVVRTLLDVFPHVSLWTTSLSSEEAMFVSSVSPLKLDPEVMEAGLASAKVPRVLFPDRTVNANALLRKFVAGTETLKGWAGEGPRTRDAHPELEYAAEAAMLEQRGDWFHGMLAQLRQSSSTLVPAASMERREQLDRAAIVARRINELMAAKPISAPALQHLAEEHSDDDELRWLAAELFRDLAAEYYGQRKQEQGDRFLGLALEMWPRHLGARTMNAGRLSLSGQLGAALKEARLLEQWKPGSASPLLLQAEILGAQGKVKEAVDRLERGVQRNPYSVRGFLNLGITAGHLRQWEKARAAFDRVLELDPGNATALAQLAALAE